MSCLKISNKTKSFAKIVNYEIIIVNCEGANINMIHIIKKVFICVLFLGVIGCSSEEPDEKIQNVSMSVKPEVPIVYDFDYKYQDGVGDTITLSKNYFQVTLRVENTNQNFGLVIVGVIVEATSLTQSGGIKVDNISIGPSGNNAFLQFIPPDEKANININVGGLNKDAVGLAYSVKMTAKGFFTDPSEDDAPIGRYTQDFFFNANE